MTVLSIVRLDLEERLAVRRRELKKRSRLRRRRRRRRIKVLRRSLYGLIAYEVRMSIGIF